MLLSVSVDTHSCGEATGECCLQVTHPKDCSWQKDISHMETDGKNLCRKKVSALKRQAIYLLSVIQAFNRWGAFTA